MTLTKNRNVDVSFEVLEEGNKPTIIHKSARFHLIFYIKIDVTNKASYVAEGYSTPDLVNSTYTLVVS